MTSADIYLRRLKPLDIFIKEMKTVEQLSKVLQDDQLKELLHELHGLMECKIRRDRDADNWAEWFPRIRRARTAMRRTRERIEKAADLLDKIAEEQSHVLYIDGWTVEHQEALFSDVLHNVLQSLRTMRRDAASEEAAYATAIHPGQRTAAERRLVKDNRWSKDREEGCKFMRPNTPAIDHWFIAKAAACLEECERKTDRRIGGKAKIIAKLFEMMGDKGRIEDTKSKVAKELWRQKTDGRPEVKIYPCPGTPTTTIFRNPGES